MQNRERNDATQYPERAQGLAHDQIYGRDPEPDGRGHDETERGALAERAMPTRHARSP
jgi:hypothetical protein